MGERGRSLPAELAFALAVLPLGDIPAPPPERIPVLLITGAGDHDWEWTSASLEAILQESGRFEVTVTREPAETLAEAGALAGYRAFVLDYDGPRWGEPAEGNFLAAVRSGAGVAVIHAATNAFPGWAGYEELVGLSWREGAEHGRFRSFDVTMVDRDHPVTRTLPDLLAHPDELHHRLVNVRDVDVRVLATALSAREAGGTGEDEPMVLVREYGEGRVFHTPLGHVGGGDEETRASHLDPQFRILVVRGTEWAATGAVADGLARPNHLEPWDVKAGWRLLFNGESTNGWRSYAGNGFPAEGWEIVNGCLRHLDGGGGGDIVSAELFESFELEFEWKVARGANSGVKYRVPESGDARSMLGPEYQVLDDSGAAEVTEAKHTAAALYDLLPPVHKRLRPVGTFNRGRIVARGSTLEHWLNGWLAVRTSVGGPAWNAARGVSKFAAVDDFATPKRGHIGLQDHGGEVWFRSLRIRDLEDLPGRDVSIFDGETLAGWRELGDARWSVADGAILGEVAGGSQSFLVTERTFADFFLEVSVRNEAPGNSGIQVRSRVDPDGRLRGYQIEIDPSPRAWSGGLYDEGRRGWLQNLEHNEPGRQAFVPGQWNRYRIECVGPSIRAWVNGTQTADFVDDMDAEGLIGLQVHSGRDTRVRWRDLRLRVLDG